MDTYWSRDFRRSVRSRRGNSAFCRAAALLDRCVTLLPTSGAECSLSYQVKLLIVKAAARGMRPVNIPLSLQQQFAKDRENNIRRPKEARRMDTGTSIGFFFFGLGDVSNYSPRFCRRF
jgi:hypothetical protein